MKKKKLESEIRTPKKRNDNKKESLNEKAKSLIESKKTNKKEELKAKKSKIELKNKNKIISLEKEYQKDYDDYIKKKTKFK